MNWNEQLAASALWLLKAYAVTVIVFVLLALVLARTTRWGRQFWRLSGAYFDPRRSWRPLLVLALVLFMTLLGVRLNVLLSFWNNDLYTALQGLDAPGFWAAIRIFAVLASVWVLRALLNYYVQSALTIHWRQWLNDKLVGRMMDTRAYYLGRYVQPEIDNPDQRIQQDVLSLVSITLSLAVGLIASMVGLVEFTAILWRLSAPMSLGGIEIPRAMVVFVYAYVLITTLVAFWLGRPLIRLNFLGEKFNATYRYLLMRVREYGENIALYRGEAVERSILGRGFADVIGNAWDVVHRTLKFSGFNFVVNQLTTVFPLIVQAPRMFAGQIKLGDVMQSAQAFNQVENSLSFFRESYDTFTSYRAVLDRLDGFERNIEGAAALEMPPLQPTEQGLTTADLSVHRPDGQVLVQDLDLQLTPGRALLIRGASGTGKTTLLRTLAGLWPFARGRAARPQGEGTLFLSQRPYLPLGSLRAALAYPSATVDHELARQVLAEVKLEHLADQLDDEKDWSQVLSPGEQQRLAFGRALVNRPRLIFLDEATSATDGALEQSLYALLRKRLPEAAVVSVGHRESLAAFHDEVLSLQAGGAWTLSAARPA